MLDKINKRRTFAIISHPDAGKTTLTEKMLLYGNAIDLAGSVTAKKKQRDTASDWMELEKKRGISVSSTLLQFEYKNYVLNLLDTPGHKDFSEDTYRVLMAVDSVIMIIDGAKGIEAQTLKLFQICKKRHIPIFTFINKLDRPIKPPLELLDQIEAELGIAAYPLCWPLDSGPGFKGVYNRETSSVNLFERVPGGAFKAPVSIKDITDDSVKNILPQNIYSEVCDEISLLEEVHGEIDIEKVHNGQMSLVYFGSAVSNFGIDLMLEGFLKYSIPPMPREMNDKKIEVDDDTFSAFIFKIQTNMNPKHRDKMVFARICSGKFYRDMNVYNTRTQKTVRISSSHTIFGKERHIVDEGYAGDIVGFITNAEFHIGDTLSSDKSLFFKEIPRFAPECFAQISNVTTAGYKSFRKGLDHLLAEDIVQAFTLDNDNSPLPLLGAVGMLQFDVLTHRLQNEYGVESRLEMKNYTDLRWVRPESQDKIKGLSLPSNCVVGKDDQSRMVLIFQGKWSLNFFVDKNPGINLTDSPDF